MDRMLGLNTTNMMGDEDQNAQNAQNVGGDQNSSSSRNNRRRLGPDYTQERVKCKTFLRMYKTARGTSGKDLFISIYFCLITHHTKTAAAAPEICLYKSIYHNKRISVYIYIYS